MPLETALELLDRAHANVTDENAPDLEVSPTCISNHSVVGPTTPRSHRSAAKQIPSLPEMPVLS